MAGENNAEAELRSQPPPGSTDHHEPSMCSLSLETILRRLKALDVKQDDKLANILDVVGEFGTFQRRLVALTFIPSILSAFFILADYFVFADQDPYCNTSWILAVGPNLSEAEQMNLTLPRAPNGSFLTCLMYLPVPWDLESIIKFGLNNTATCQNGWIYPNSKKRSLINEFDLVCGLEPKKDIVQTMFMAGLLIGSLIFGFISDKVGRYPTIMLSLLGLAIFGLGTAFASNFQQYIFFRFCVSQAVVCYTVSSLSLITEWLLGSHRAHAIILEHCFYSVGAVVLTGLSYILPHWRLLFLVGGVSTFPLVFYIWVLPESPRWLMMKGKVKEAKEVLSYAAGVNKKTIPLNLLEELQLPAKKVTKASILDFCNSRQRSKVTLPMGCVWFTIAFSYYTLNLKLRDFGVSIHFRQVIPRIMEVSARLCSIFLLEQLGRKWSLSFLLLQAAILCLLLLFLPQEPKPMMVLVIVFGEFSLAATVTVFFIYTAELLPTVLRATGLGLVSLAMAAGALSSLTITSQTRSLLPVFLCCISVVLALFFSSLLPETHGQPLCDSLERYSRQISFQRDIFSDFSSSNPLKRITDVTSENSHSDGMSEEAVKNTILNSQVVNSSLSSNAQTKESTHTKASGEAL